MALSDTTSIFAIPKLHRRLKKAIAEDRYEESQDFARLLEMALIGNMEYVVDAVDKRYKKIDYDKLLQSPHEFEETLRDHLRLLCGSTSRSKIAKAMNVSISKIYSITGYKARSLSLPDFEDFYRAAYRVTVEDVRYFQTPDAFMAELFAFYAENVQSHDFKKVADCLFLDRKTIFRRFWRLRTNATLRTIQDGLMLIKRYQNERLGDEHDSDVTKLAGEDRSLSEGRPIQRMELA